MGGCKCTFRGCTNTSANSPGMHFFHYPLKDHERCFKWVTYANTRDILNLPFSKARNKVVCETHFKDDCFMNYKKERLVHYAIPTIVRLSKDCCLDYEESDNPTPKPLFPSSKSHLIPPLGKRKSQTSNEEYVLGIFEDCDIENSIISTDQETVVLNELSPSPKVKKVEAPKILNSFFSRNKKIDKNIMKDDGSIHIFEEDTSNVNIIFKDHESYNSEQLTIGCISINENQNDCTGKPFANIAVQGEKCEVFKIKDDARCTITYEGIKQHSENIEQIDNINSSNESHIEEIFVNFKTQAEKHQMINARNSTASKVTSQNSKNMVKAANDTDGLQTSERNYFNDILEKEKRIKELEEQLAEEINKNKLKIKKNAQAQVEAISTSRQLVTSSTSLLTKAQLFNNIKKYLSPSMATLVRMEMFGGPDREWKADERQVSVELLRLGDDVFKYMRDEWRFRLPPLKRVEKWLNEYKSDEDAEDL